MPGRDHAVAACNGRFVGRQTELAQLRSAFSGTRLLTLVGPGGVGKSRLAQRLIDHARGRFPGGVHVLDVSNVTSAERTDFELKFAASAGRQLLVLDNCEIAARDCAELASRALQRGASVCVLATSREPLRIEPEVVWRVPPALRQSDAAKLFSMRIRAQLPGFALNADTALAVERICRRLEGLPLALEIAARHVPRMGIFGMATRLDGTYALNLAGDDNAPVRQRSLRAMIDWSYALLAEAERILFARLAVFVGGWTLSAAETVCSDERVPRTLVAALLDGMVSRSLILRDDGGATSRFRFAPLVRQYARDCLRTGGEAPVLKQRHAEYMAAKAASVDPAGIDVAGIAHLAEDMGNLRAALRWAPRSNDPDLTLRLGVASYSAWYFQGRFAEGETWLRHCLAVPRQLPHHSRRAVLAALACHLALLASGQKPARWLLARVFGSERAIERSADVGLLHHTRALIELWSGNLEAAAEVSARAEAVLSEGQPARDDEYPLELAQPTLGARISAERGEERHANHLATVAASLAQARGSRLWHARAYHVQALLAARARQHALALQLIESAIQSQRAVADRAGLVETLCALGEMRLAAERPDQSLDAYGEAISVARVTGHRLGLIWGLEGVAQALSHTHAEDAVQLEAVCAGLRAKYGSRRWPSQTRSANAWLARVRAELGAGRFNAVRAAGHARGLTDALQLVNPFSSSSPSASSSYSSPLTAREREVLRYLMLDASHHQIAATLSISIGTVRAHVEHMFGKLGLHSRAQLVAWALQGNHFL